MKIRQHEAIRVPQGWTGQDRALIIQLERILTEIYRLMGIADSVMVTGVGFDADSHCITVTIDGETADVAKVATLDGNNRIPAAQLPSYVDDVEEYADTAHFPTTGEADKIYVALDTGFTYRWSGTQYVRLNTYDEATQSNSGLMSAADKTKLDSVEAGANNYSLPLAANGTRGGAQVGFTTDGANRKYAVLLSGEKMYVEVPWTDHHAWTDIDGRPTNVSAFTNDAGYLTQHQDISGKADKATTVTAVTYDSTNKKITRTINGATADVVTVSTIKGALGAFTWGQLANR